MSLVTRSSQDNFKVTRAIVTELIPKSPTKATEVARLMTLVIRSGLNDFYLRSIDEDGVKKMLDCDESFARGFLAKVFCRLRSNELPPPAEPACAEDYEDAANHLRSNACVDGKIIYGQQSDYISSLFFTKNILMNGPTLSKKLRGLREFHREGSSLVDKGGRIQLLSDRICREVITPALNLFRAKGQAKWTPMVKMLMRQLLRVQNGVESPQGIMKLIGRHCDSDQSDSAQRMDNLISIIQDEGGSGDDDNSDESGAATEQHEKEGDSDDAPNFVDDDDAVEPLDTQEVYLLSHARDSKSSTKRLMYQEFPSNRTFKRYKKKYGWAERKLEVVAAHRQAGSSGAAIRQNYEELGRQYIQHDIQHPDQIIVTDEIRWAKSWENALALISCMIASPDKRSQSGGPGKISDGVTATPMTSIIGTMYAVQVVIRDSHRNITDKQVVDAMVHAGFPREAIVVHRTPTGYQTAQSFKKLLTFLILRLHACEGTAVTSAVESVPLKRKYITIADGASTHPFQDISFCLLIGLVGIFPHQQEANSTHLTNLYDRYVFLMTKLYAAKEVMLAILMAYNPPIATDEVATLWLETIMRELKHTIDPTKECGGMTDRLITDSKVLDKLNTIVTYKFDSFFSRVFSLASSIFTHKNVGSARSIR